MNTTVDYGKEPASPGTRLVTLIIPVFNEEGSIGPFLKEVGEQLEKLEERFELLFVDDGSDDATVNCINTAADSDERIRVIEFSRNFGKEAALTAGLAESRGDAVIPIDVDLQDPPQLICQFIEKWKDGYDVVYGERRCRKTDSFMKRKSADLFYGILNKLSHISMPPNAGDYRLMDRRVVDVINLLPERNRFMKGLFAWAGFKSIGVKYDRPSRKVGHTKFTYWNLWNFALDGVMSFSTLPLRIWSYLGAFFAVSSMAYGTFIVARTLIIGRDVPGYASLMTALLFLGGIQLISLGIIGEYIGRLFVEIKQRPVYVIKKKPTDK